MILRIPYSLTGRIGALALRPLHRQRSSPARKLAAVTGSMTTLESKGPFPTEEALYAKFGLSFIEPELREGYREVKQAAQGMLPVLVTTKDICGELHAHSTSSDGANSIEQMAVAARAHGYEYIGITDHFQSLKIAGGVSVEDLWKQIRFTDQLNELIDGIRILKSAEVDILADGSLDYPDDLLRELDYTVCSVHSRFGLGKSQQTERILRAMDNRYFNILGHATGRLLLKRPGYELEIERVIGYAKQTGCFFEINSRNIRKLELIESRGDSAGRQSGPGCEMLGCRKRCRRHWTPYSFLLLSVAGWMNSAAATRDRVFAGGKPLPSEEAQLGGRRLQLHRRSAPQSGGQSPAGWGENCWRENGNHCQ